MNKQTGRHRLAIRNLLDTHTDGLKLRATQSVDITS
jgi:hypothetical protein